MKISVFGLGYVGCISLGCLARNGNEIVGVDNNECKVDLINSGKPTIIEKDIDHLISKYYLKGKISATVDYRYAVLNSRVAFICVGTPSSVTGQLDLSHVYQTAEQIGSVIKGIDWFYVVVIRSTVFPGTNVRVGKIIEEYSGKKRNEGFAVVSNPEFLREGSAVEDYFNPSMTVAGTENDYAAGLLEEIYKPVNAPFYLTDIEVAEMIKYVNNAFHALKICFANEVGTISRSLGIDSRKLMELLVLDTRLNISPAYLKPGMPYGGSCLPKDLRGLYTIAYDKYIRVPLLGSISDSNESHKNRVFELIEKGNSKKIGIAGLAFKSGTDDLRYSPAVEIVERLLGKGYTVKIYDQNVVLSKLLGANKNFIDDKLPHVSGVLVSSISELLIDSDTIVLVHYIDAFKEYQAMLRQKSIIDLVGYMEFKNFPRYIGLAW
jgi:GDP-mannose 6-dehydrogenase